MSDVHKAWVLKGGMGAITRSFCTILGCSKNPNEIVADFYKYQLDSLLIIFADSSPPTHNATISSGFVLSSGNDARFSLAEKTVQLRKKLVTVSRALGGLYKDYVTAPREDVAMEMEASANEINALLELIGPTQQCASVAA
jgi:hypothetical protein